MSSPQNSFEGILRNREKFGDQSSQMPVIDDTPIIEETEEEVVVPEPVSKDQIPMDIKESKKELFFKMKRRIVNLENKLEVIPFWKNGFAIFTTVYALLIPLLMMIIIWINRTKLHDQLPLFYDHKLTIWARPDKLIFYMIPVAFFLFNLAQIRFVQLVYNFNRNLVLMLNASLILINTLMFIGFTQVLHLTINDVFKVNFDFFSNMVEKTGFTKDMVPFPLLALVLTFFLTPLVAQFAKNAKVFDLPAQMRSRTDTTKSQRLHTSVKLRLGGLAIISVFLALTFIHGDLNYKLVGICIGSIILTIVGFMDDKFEISPRVQLFGQLLAAITAVVFGITMANVNVTGFIPDLEVFSKELIHIGNFVYTFKFPADLITIIWILTIINALNWMCGMDSLGESITFITGLGMALIGLETGNSHISAIIFIFIACIAGFIPYNFPPSKIMGGSVADFNFGYLLATFAILSEAKSSTALLLLIIPLLDMFYVLIRRILEHKVFNPIKLLSISGRIHLHHRILNMGFTEKETLYIEISIFSMISIVAMIIEGIGNNFYYLHAILAAIFLMIIVKVSLDLRKRKSIARIQETPRARVVRDISPEEKYKY